ncbi:unnamed protein product [Knipowitschia caucasica]|uniref:Sulfotransferase n=1 Tax=Knipowitschia caucasica TaxID=637954 RepID=A0AAV2KZ58_KNICA
MPRCRLTVSTMILLVLLPGGLQWCVFLWMVCPAQPLWLSAPSQEKIHVLLLSSWRSGSSFLGQVFSQHPSVFYLMEPGWHVWTNPAAARSQSPSHGSQRPFSAGTFLCDFFSTMEGPTYPYSTTYPVHVEPQSGPCSPDQPAPPHTPDPIQRFQ